MVDLAFLSLILGCPISLRLFLYFIVKSRPVKIPIKNRHVFITDGSSSIDLVLTHKTTAEGTKVSILARNMEKLNEAKQAIKLSAGRDVAVCSVDMRDFNYLKKAIKEAGSINVLLCNQGVFVSRELEG